MIKHGVSKSHIIKQHVNSISIDKLLRNIYLISRFTILDTEGYDGEIVIDFLSKMNLRPIIIFEYIHINHEIFKKLLEKLINKKFYFYKIDENILCFPTEFGDSTRYLN